MSPLDASVVRRKQQRILENLRELQGIQALGRQKYLEARLERKAAERWLQELIDAAIDINAHLLAGLGYAVPEQSYDTFVQMGRHGLLPQELAHSLAPCAGLRNRLIREYDALDDRLVWDSIEEAQQLFPAYMQAVESFLIRSGF